MPQQANVQRNRRQIRNFLLNPRVQYRYGLYFFAVAGIAAAVTQMLLIYAFQRIMGQAMLNTSIDPLELAVAVGQPLRSLEIWMALLFPLLAVVCGAFAIWLTHRFVGPQVAIRRHIDRLKAGDYGQTCTFRPDDELKGVALALNELTEALRQEDGRHGIAA